jgi:phosphoacetylglucosamine mutase
LILFSCLLLHILKETPLEWQLSLDIGVVQTAYANGASTRYVQDVLRFPTVCAATGVKHLHPAAHARDIGLYFEANGHGSVLLRTDAIQRKSLSFASNADVQRALKRLGALSRLLSQACGDAIGDLIACEVALRALGWSQYEWLLLYTDLPSLQTVVAVKNPSTITNTPDQTKALTPPGLQRGIDAIVAATADPSARAFVRPSGTEPVVRVYAESSTHTTTEAISASVRDLVLHLCNENT